MKIIIFGKGIRAGRCLNEMVKEGYKPYAILIQDDCSILTSLCETYGIKVLREEEDILSEKPDLLILSGYTKILKKYIIYAPILGTINLHGGKLPQYRGASVLNWQIINGEKEGGITILKVDEGIDTGDILAEAEYDIEFEDTIADITEKANNLFPSLLIQVLKDIEQGKPKISIQNLLGGAYWHKRHKDDSRILWEKMTALEIYNLIRASESPYSAFTFLNNKKIEVLKADVCDVNYRGMAGRIVKKTADGIIVIAKDRGILLQQFTPNEDLKIGNILI